MLTSAHYRFLLNLIAEKYGPGYASDQKIPGTDFTVGALQASLSIGLQLAEQRERAIRKQKGEES